MKEGREFRARLYGVKFWYCISSLKRVRFGGESGLENQDSVRESMLLIRSSIWMSRTYSSGETRLTGDLGTGTGFCDCFALFAPLVQDRSKVSVFKAIEEVTEHAYMCTCFLDACGVVPRSEAGDLARELEGVPAALAELDPGFLAGTTISTTGNDLRRFELEDGDPLLLTAGCEGLLPSSPLSEGPKNLLTKFNIMLFEAWGGSRCDRKLLSSEPDELH